MDSIAAPVFSYGYFDQFPDEIKLEILKYLPAKEIIKLGLTCKSWYDFVSSNASPIIEPLFLREIDIVKNNPRLSIRDKYSWVKKIEGPIEYTLCFQAQSAQSELETECVVKLDPGIIDRIKKGEEKSHLLSNEKFNRYMEGARAGVFQAQVMLGFYYLCANNLPEKTTVEEKAEILGFLNLAQQTCAVRKSSPHLSYVNYLQGLRICLIDKNEIKGMQILEKEAEAGLEVALGAVVSIYQGKLALLEQHKGFVELMKTEDGQQEWCSAMDFFLKWVMKKAKQGCLESKFLVGKYILEGKVLASTQEMHTQLVSVAIQNLTEAHLKGHAAASFLLAQYYLIAANQCAKLHNISSEYGYLMKAKEISEAGLKGIGDRNAPMSKQLESMIKNDIDTQLAPSIINLYKVVGTGDMNVLLSEIIRKIQLANTLQLLPNSNKRDQYNALNLARMHAVALLEIINEREEPSSGNTQVIEELINETLTPRINILEPELDLNRS